MDDDQDPQGRFQPPDALHWRAATSLRGSSGRPGAPVSLARRQSRLPHDGGALMDKDLAVDCVDTSSFPTSRALPLAETSSAALPELLVTGVNGSIEWKAASNMIVGQDNDTPAWVPDDYYCSQLLPPIADPTGLRSVANGSGRSNIFSVPTAQGIGYLPSQDPFNWQFGAQAMVEDPTEPTLSISSLLATELDVTPMDQGTCGSQGPPNETPLRLIAGTIATDLVGVSATVDDRNLSSNSVDLSTLFAGYDSLGWVTTMADQYQQMALPEHLPGPSTSRRPDALTNQPELVFPFAPGELTAQDSSNPSLPTSIEAKLRLMLLGKGLSQESIAHFIGLLPDSVLVPSTSPRQSEHAISMEITRPGANCARCSMLKKACLRDANGQCIRCREAKLPPYICTNLSLTTWRTFEKWLSPGYKEMLVTVHATIDTHGDTGTIQLQHYTAGPCLDVPCTRFVPTWAHQTAAHRRRDTQIYKVETSPFSLLIIPDIRLYVASCVPCLLAEILTDDCPVASVLRIAMKLLAEPVIYACFRMLTVLRLLRIGWRFPEGSSETLGMTAVDDVNSPWHRIIPVPRTLLNQLNHELELELVQLHKEVLRAIQDMFRNHRRSKLLSATFATFLLLHVLELDAGRLIHWIRHKDPQLWIHPDRPDVLMQSSLSACDSLLCHYFIAFGARPVHEYQNSRYKSSLHGRDMAIAEELEMCISQHEKQNLIGRGGSEAYQEGDSSSVAYTISSLLFQRSTNGSRVTGFY